MFHVAMRTAPASVFGANATSGAIALFVGCVLAFALVFPFPDAPPAFVFVAVATFLWYRAQRRDSVP